jgi:hypothetical protein
VTTTLYNFLLHDEFNDIVQCLWVVPNGENTAAEALALGKRAFIASNKVDESEFADNTAHVVLEAVKTVDVSATKLLDADRLLSLVMGGRHFVEESELAFMEAAIEAENEAAIAAFDSLAEQLGDDEPIVEYDETPVRNDILVGLG